MSHLTYQPIDPRDAATVPLAPRTDEAETAAESQAALLLIARAGVLAMEDGAEDMRQEADEAGFGLPPLEPLQREHRLRLAEATRPLGASPKELAEETSDLGDEIVSATHRLYEEPNTQNAAALFEVSLHSRHPLVRVAAAAGARETTRLRPLTRQTLEEGCLAEDPLVAGVAREAMAHIDRHHPYLRAKVAEPPEPVRRSEKSETAVITHGTWAAGGTWYRPGGDFYDALALNRPDLHLHPQSFTWSGDYSRAAWREGAAGLSDWLSNEGLESTDYFAHSHGATVANRATRLGVDFPRLVMMSWPVRDDWLPKPGTVGRIIDVRVRLDLVILVDGGGQRLRTNQFDVSEHRNGWFNHFVTHEPDYWTEHGLWGKV